MTRAIQSCVTAAAARLEINRLPIKHYTKRANWGGGGATATKTRLLHQGESPVSTIIFHSAVQQSEDEKGYRPPHVALWRPRAQMYTYMMTARKYMEMALAAAEPLEGEGQVRVTV